MDDRITKVLNAIDENFPKDGEFGLDSFTMESAITERLMYLSLARTRGHILRAASILGLNRTTLVERMKKFGIKREWFFSGMPRVDNEIS